MTGTCRRADCGINEGLPCEMGLRNYEDCPEYVAASSRESSATTSPTRTDSTADTEHAQRLPWTGRGLGMADIVLVSARGPARLVGLIGPFNAGKTALLTAIFTHFARTGIVTDFAFSGSFTLHAWMQLRHYTTWPSPSGGTFPPHTPDTGERVPSLLHLAFRERTGRLYDVLFTDAPGEWFTRWVRDRTTDDAAGARWIAQHATHFIYVVDRQGLAGGDVGRVRHNTLALARVLGEHRRGRPLIAVWTKSDLQCDEEIEAPIRARLTELLGEHISVNVHVEDPACVGLLTRLLEELPSASQPTRALEPASAFVAYRTQAS